MIYYDKEEMVFEERQCSSAFASADELISLKFQPHSYASQGKLSPWRRARCTTLQKSCSIAESALAKL